MKKISKKVLALLLCVAMCMNMCITAFAANESNTKGVTFSLVLDNASITKSNEAQTVTATLKMSQMAEVIDMEYIISCDDSFTVGEPTTPGGSGSSYNPTTKKMVWYATDDVTTDTLGTFTITIPANTAAGTYPISISDILLSNNTDADYWEKTATASTTLTITEAATPTPAGAYNASIGSTNTTVTVGDKVLVAVNVTSDGTYTDFNACEIEVAYSSQLQFDGNGSTLNDATVSVSGSTLYIVDKGEAESLGNGVYTLAFTATSDGAATVALVNAAFGTNEEEETQDLRVAVCDTTPVAITVNKAAYAVTLPDIFAGVESVEDGEDYTFSVESVTGSYYDYTNVSATVGGNSATVIDNGNGTWTIKNVNGPVVITATRSPKQYDVTIDGDTVANDGATATYGTPYAFTLPEDLAASTVSGYNYALTSVTINGAIYTGYSTEGKTYTIPGTDITGVIVITITKTVTDPNTVKISVDGTGAGAVVGTYPTTVIKGESHTLTISPEAGYTYTVTADGYTVSQDGNTYTISNITGDVTFMVVRAVDTTGVTVSEYVKLDGTNVWLIKNTTELEGKVYTYDGNAMFWSTKYNAYCTLVVSSTKPVPTANNFAITPGSATNVDYSGDVNKTGKVDANDAQLVYNIYNVQYSGFTENVTVEKYLRADVNGNGTVDVTDAAAVVSTILA